jgi:hypothetical protein
MNWNFDIPAIVRSKINISAKVQAAWKSAVWTVKQGQDKFLAAYKATIDEQIPEWETTWKTDPHFPARLSEIEDYIKAICRSNKMPLTTFNRYRQGARKSLLMGTPFRFATQNFTVDEARQIAEGGAEVAKEIRHQKNVRHAATVIAKHATLLPIPNTDDNKEDYLEAATKALAAHLDKVRQTLGADVANQLLLRSAVGAACQEGRNVQILYGSETSSLPSRRQPEPSKPYPRVKFRGVGGSTPRPWCVSITSTTCPHPLF